MQRLPAVFALLFSAGCHEAEPPETPAPALTDPSADVGVDHGAEVTPGPWQDLLAQGLESFAVTNFGGEGEVRFEGDGLHLDFGSPLTGVHWIGDELPTCDYELELVASREAGTDFFAGLTFPVGPDHLTLVLGGWAGATVGLSCIDGRDASENETTRYVRFDLHRPVTARVEVRAERIRVWLDEEPVADLPREGHEFSLRGEVLPCRPLGVAAFLTQSWIRSLKLRTLRS